MASLRNTTLAVLPTAATFSKSPRFWGGPDFQPKYVLRGRGCEVFCSDGVWRTDYVSGLGAITLGYGNRHFQRKVARAVREGAGFSLPTLLEQQVAERIVTMVGQHVPGWSPDGLGLRFCLSGTDSTTIAARLARAVTGRTRVLRCGYSGWSDWAISTTPPAWGVVPKGPEYVQDFRWGYIPSEHDSADYWPATSVHTGGLPSLAELLGDGPPVACVMMETPPEDVPDGWFDHVRKLCDEHGALFALDETVTALRYHLGGAAARYGASPDLVMFGKGLGNGIPISCVVGHRELFSWFDPDARPSHDPVFVSSTHFGNAVSLAAADAVLDIWDDACVQHVWHIGQLLMDGLRQAGYTVVGHPPRSLLQFDSQAERAFFIREMAGYGILINRPNLPNLAHTERDVQRTVQVAVDVRRSMAGRDLEREMAGKLPLVLFSNR